MSGADGLQALEPQDAPEGSEATTAPPELTGAPQDTPQPVCAPDWPAIVASLAGDGPTPPKGMDHHMLVMLGDRLALCGLEVRPHAAGGWLAYGAGFERVCVDLAALEQCAAEQMKARARRANADAQTRRDAKKREKKVDPDRAQGRAGFRETFMAALAGALAGLTVRQAGGAS